MQVSRKATPEKRRRQAVLRDSVITKLVNATPEQIDSWVDHNVVNLEDIKDVLKRILKQLAVLSG